VLLSQDIENEPPSIWLQKKREYFNYRQAKIIEPVCPDCFKFVWKHSIRKALEYYNRDEQYLYAFDPDQALLAYPIATLKLVKAAFRNVGITLARDDQDAVLRYWRDRYG